MDKTIEFLEDLYRILDQKEQEIKSKINSISDVQQSLNEKIKKIEQSVSSIVDIEDSEIINLLNSIKIEDDLVTEHDIKELISNPNYDHSSERKNLLFIIMQAKYLLQYGLTLEENQIKEFKDTIKRISANNKEQFKQMNRLNSEIQKNNVMKSVNSNMRRDIEDNELIVPGIEYLNDTLLKDDRYTEEEKRSILFEVINHNASVYKSKMENRVIPEPDQLDNSEPIREPEIEPDLPIIKLDDENDEMDSVELGNGISMEDLKEIFDKYDYNVDDLLIEKKKKNNDIYLNFLLRYGDKARIDTILKTFKEYGIEAKDFEFYKTKKNGTKEQSEGNIKTFTNILLRSSKEVIDNVIAVANGTGIDDIMSLKTAFITSKAYTRRNGESIDQLSSQDKAYAYGAYSDFLKNIEFFKEEGFDLSKISCPSVLTSSNNIVKSNYKTLKYYDLDIKNSSGKDTLSSLESNNVCESSEMFVELHRDGIKYLNKNLSRIKLEPYNLVFYNAYYMVKNGYTPFKNIESTGNMQLRGEVVNISRGGTFGITNDNKDEILNRYVPDSSVKEKYDKYVELEMKKVFKSMRDNNGLLYKNEVTYDKFITSLDEKYGNKDIYAYIIDGIRISKVKVLRLYSILKDKITPENQKEIINYILTYNSIIDKDEMYKIDKVVEEETKNRKLG